MLSHSSLIETTKKKKKIPHTFKERKSLNLLKNILFCSLIPTTMTKNLTVAQKELDKTCTRKKF